MKRRLRAAPREVLAEVHAGTSSRAAIREGLEAVGSLPDDPWAERVLRSYAVSEPPPAWRQRHWALVDRARELAVDEGEANASMHTLGPTATDHFARLRRAFDGKRCEYCAANAPCMVRGCTDTPLASCTASSSARFRCVGGLHCCNAHGLQLLTNRCSVTTNNVYELKDGRFARNLFVGVSRKRHARHEATSTTRRAVRRRRLDALRDVGALGRLPARKALGLLVDHNAPTLPHRGASMAQLRAEGRALAVQDDSAF